MRNKNKWFPSSYHVMVKPRGSICNLDCEYCYFLSKERMYPESAFLMEVSLLETFTKQYIQSQKTSQITFAWQGGEPTLMGINFFRKAVEFQKKVAQPWMQIENAIQTNGTLLDDELCDFFKDNNFLVGISIDGPEELHDKYRKNKGGEGSFQEVIKGLNLLKKHQVEFNVLCTVNSDNAEYPLEVYKFLKNELGALFIQFIPIVERDNKTGFQKGNKVTHRTVSGKQYGNFLINIFDEWVKNEVGEVFIQIFDVALGKWVGSNGGLCVFEKTCGLALALEHNGDLFSCDHYVEPKYKLGNIIKAEMIDLVSNHRQMDFGLDKERSLPRQCKDCNVRFACNGGCPKNRIKHSVNGEFGLNYLCEGYYSFFNHINEPMKKMATYLRSNRPPSDIMEENTITI